MFYSISAKISRLLWRALPLAGLIVGAVPLTAQTTPVSGTTTVANSEQITPSAGNISIPNTAVVPTTNNLKLDALFEHDFKADLKDGAAGDLNVNQFELRGDYALNLTNQDRLIIGADYLHLDYNFDGTEPFGNANQVGANVYYTHGIDNQWGFFGFLYGGFAAENSSSMDRGGQVAVAVGPTWDTGKNLTLAFGPMYYTRIEDDGKFSLMLNLDWTFAPQWNLYLYTGISSGATVTFDVFNNHQTILDASLAYDSFWFSAHDNPAGVHQGVDQTDLTLKLGVRQSLTDIIFLRGFISAIFERKYQFYAGDNSTNSFQVDPTVGIGLELGVAF